MMETQQTHFQPNLATVREVQSLIQYTGSTLYIQRLYPVRDGWHSRITGVSKSHWNYTVSGHITPFCEQVKVID